MPDKVLSKQQLEQLDSNIRKMVDSGLGEEDIMSYAKEFKSKYGADSGPVPAKQVTPVGLPTFQEQQATLQQVQSKYDKAVQDDRSMAGKLASTVYNGLVVGSLESLAQGVTKLSTMFPSAPYLGVLPTQAKRMVEIKGQEGIKKAADVVRSGYVTREEEKQLQGKFDITNGIGLDDLVGLTAMSGRIAGDLGLGAITGGSSFLIQGFNDAVDDYDEAVKSMGLPENQNARALYGIAGGTINGLLEKFAIDKLVGDGPVFKAIQKKAIANVLKNTSTMTGKAAIDGIEKFAKEEIKQLTSNLKSKGLRAGYRALVEGGTEGLQAALEDGAKFASNWAQGQEVFNEEEIKNSFAKNILNSAVAGSVFGPVIGFGVDKTFGRNINTEILNDIANAKSQEDIDKLNQDLEETFNKYNFSEEERKIVLDNARRYAEVKQTLPSDTPAEVQKLAIPKIESRLKIDNEIQAKKAELETVDESVKPSYEQEISLLQDKRAQINDDIREAITGQKFQYTEENGKFFKQSPDGQKEEISKNRYDLEQIKLEDDATTKGQGPIQEVGTAGDISQRAGTQERGAQAAPTKTDSRYRNISSEEAVGIPKFLGATVVYKLPNRKITGTLIQEGQTLSVEDENGDVVAELGNIDELSNMSPEQMNLTVIEPNVETTEKGFTVDGKELLNENENPFDAVSVDKNGNVMNVVLTTAGGKRRKFRGRVAQKLADQISQKEDQRLQQEFALPTPKAPKVITTQPAIAKITEENISELDNVQGTPIQKKVLNDVKTVVSAIGAAVKNITGFPVSVNVHNQDSFGNAVKEAGGTEQDSSSRGFYMASDGSIHLNMDNIDSDTMLHEGFHPILDILERYKPEVINELFTQLESIPEAAPIIEQAKRNYTGDITQKKEAITDFVAGVADGRIVLNPSNFEKIKNFILDMLNKIGIGGGGSTLMNVQNEQDLVNLAKFVTEKFTTGETITLEGLTPFIENRKDTESEEQGLVMAAGEITPERIQQSKVSDVNPIQFSKPEKFKEVELVSLPVKSMNDVYNEFGGRAIAINSDPTRVGNLKMPSGKEIFMYGGLNYTALKPNVDGEIGFASTRMAKPKQVAKITKSIFKDRNGEGVVLVAAQKPDSMLGNAYALEYTLDAISALPKSQLRSSQFKDEFFGKDIVAIKDAFGEKEYKEFVKKFRGADLSNPSVMNDMIETLLTDIGNNFIARNSLVKNMLAGIVAKSTRTATKGEPGYVSVSPNKFIAKQLFDRFGLNQEKLFYEIGEKGIVDEYMNNGNWGFVTTGFTLDGNIDPNTIQDKGVVHPQFNAKFHGKNPFILDGGYLIDKLFPPEEIITKTGKPYTKKASLMVAGSMYPKGAIQKVEAPQAEGVPQFQKGDKLLLKHGGATKIVRFDESKIKGGLRGELGYGYYFSEDDKYKDYGNEVTTIDASKLNFIDEYSEVPENFIPKLDKWIVSKFDKSDVLESFKIQGSSYISKIEEELQKNPSITISNLRKNVNNYFPRDMNQFWSNMMVGIGIDGMKATMADGTIRQVVLYPQEKLNQLIVDQPQFQKSPTKTVKQPVKRFLKDQFIVGGILGKEVMGLKEEMAGELADEMTKAEEASKKASNLIKKYSSVVTSNDIEDFLTSKPNANRQIPMDLAAVLSEMRAHVDNLTERLINLGVIDDPEEVAKYRENKGKYLLRSYEIFNAQPTAIEKMLLGKSKTRIDIDNVKKKLKNVDQAKVDNALRFLEREILKGDPTLTPEQVKEQAIIEANKILSDTESKFAPKKYIGSTNVKSLEARLDIAPEIRALMGEYTDPIYNYYASIFKLAALTSNRKFLNDLKEQGMGKFLFKDATRDASVQIASEGSEALKPLAGLYTFPEIKEALEKQEKLQASIIDKMLGRFRMLKTVYNPGTHVKNIIGNAGFFISNGHWTYMDKVWDLIKSNPQEREELMSILRKQGVLNSSVGIGELNSYFDRYDNVEDFLQSIQKQANDKSIKGKSKEIINAIKRTGKDVNAAIKKAYQLEDDVFKIMAFVNESNRYANALFNKDYSKLNNDEKAKVNKVASENVKNTYPTFSRAPKFVKGLSKYLLLGNFLTFPVESVRISYNTLKLAKDEIDSGNPKLRAIGMSRIIGTLAYNSLFSTLMYYTSMAGVGLGGMLGSMFDDEEEKETRKAINLLREPFTNNSDIIPTKFSDGRLVYTDIGSLDSYSYQKKVWNAFWDNLGDEEGFNKAIYASVKQFLDPYLTFDFALKTFSDLRNNKEEDTGMQIYNPESIKYEDRVLDISKFLLRKFGPGIVNSAMKSYRYYGEGDAEKLNNEIASQFVRTYTVDAEKRFSRNIYADRSEGNNMADVGFKKRLDDAERIYINVKNNKAATQQEKDAAYSQAIEAYKRILNDVSKHYQAALRSGVPQEKLITILAKSRLGDQRGRPEIYSIMKGVADLPDETYIRK